jgi:hypothetical protein
VRESSSPAPLGKGCSGELGLCWSMNSTLLIPTIGTSEPIFGTATQGQLLICMSRITLFVRNPDGGIIHAISTVRW